MALGKKIIDITGEDIVRGMSTSSNLSDGGFSPETDGVNLLYSPGAAYVPASPTDKSTNVQGEIIASSPDPQLLGAHRVFVDDEGHFYSSNSAGTMTLLRTDAVQTYAAGFTSMTPFDGSVFTTSKEKICKWTVDSSFNASYFSFTNTNVMHPSLTFENNIYYGDKNLLLRQTDASATPTTILTLSSDQNIVALSIDPGSGKMLISTTTQLNVSDTTPTVNKVHYYDGFSNKTSKTNLVDDMITAFYPNGGDIYITYGVNLGYWNGSGIRFLWKFKNMTRSADTLAYSQHITNIESTLYVIDGSQILAHGPIRQGGNKVFYYAFKNQPGGVATNLTHICNMGSNLLGLAYATDQFMTFDTVGISSIYNQTFWTNNYEFPNPVWIRRFKIWYNSGVGQNVDPGSVTIYDTSTVAFNVGNSGLFSLKNNTTATEYYHEVDNVNVKTDMVNFRLLMGTVQAGIKRFVVYGDPADLG